MGWAPAAVIASQSATRVALAAVELEAVLAGVAGAGDEALRAGDLPDVEVVVPDLAERHGGERLEQLLRPRPLHREQADLVEMSLRRTLIPPFWSTMCSQARAVLDALTTIISLSSKR